MNRYLKGRRYEYKIKKELEKEGWLVIRSAGSHGPVDLVAIHPILKVIKFIQCKTYKITEKKEKSILEPLLWLNNVFRGEVEVL